MIELGQRHLDSGVGLMGLDDPLVVALGEHGEGVGVVRAAVDQRAGPALDDRLDVLAGDRLVGLEGVGHGQHLRAVLESAGRSVRSSSSSSFSSMRSPRPVLEQVLLASLPSSPARPAAAADADPWVTPWEATVEPMPQ